MIMRDDKIKNAFMKLTPPDGLSERVKGLIDDAAFTEPQTYCEKPVRRMGMKRGMRAVLAAAAIMALMAVAVSAYGIFSRLFYLPGAGLVDEDGVLVIREDDIGELDITAYRTAAELDLGGYVIESVTYTGYEGSQSYTVWSRMGDGMMAELVNAQRAHTGVTVADHVISDLTLILSDGTALSPESVRYSHSGSIVYHFAADRLDTNLTVASESLGASVPAKLCLVEGAGYSYMEYPTDKGITLILCPTNADYTDWKLDFIDNSISDGLAEYLYSTSVTLERDDLTFYDLDGNPTIHDDGWRLESSEKGIDITFKVDVPNDGFNLERAELERIMMIYTLHPTDTMPQQVELPMPKDGERVDRDIVLFNAAGFFVGFKGYSREGESLTIYIDPDRCPNSSEVRVSSTYYPIPYTGSNQCTAAYAQVTVGDLFDGENYERRFATTTKGDWQLCDDGLYARTFEIRHSKDSLDDLETFSVRLDNIACLFDGNWTVNY